jgi:hypothetical protein
MPLIIPGNRQASTAYTIDQSIRFNDDENPYMGRTPSATGTEETWTWSFWVKRATLGTLQVLFQIGADKNNCDQFYFNTDDQLQYQHLDSGSNTDDLETTQVFRDASAWYHIILVADTTNAVESERIRIYVNGERVTNFATENYPTQNTPTDVNTQVLHQIGAQLSATYYSFDGYMAEIHLLDGLAYDPSFFGEFNSSGLWVPKEYTGSYGTNGFKIDGRDASDLGDDESGNGNDFTTSGLASDDQQPDSPTNNHCTWNPIEAETLITYSNGNLAIAYSGNSARNMARSTIQIPASTDAFFEMVMTSNLGSGVDFAIGIEDGTAQSDNSNSIYNNAYVIREDGNFIDQSSSGSYGVSFTNTDVIGVWRKANGDLVFYKNGTAMNSGTPAKTGLTGTMFFVAGPFNGASAEARFASSKWTNKPSGVSDSMALNTSNLGS